ncbi:hypothetical protein QUA35_25320 [Microcoleus sp. N9_B2]|uniref:hypothetical protein n=1 Tax=unclassified Microcoleus TaxID=2642155 RepID=UPI002FD50FA4
MIVTGLIGQYFTIDDRTVLQGVTLTGRTTAPCLPSAKALGNIWTIVNEFLQYLLFYSVWLNFCRVLF